MNELKHCSKCSDLLLSFNTRHGKGSKVNWCDDCWFKFWDKKYGVARRRWY